MRFTFRTIVAAVALVAVATLVPSPLRGQTTTFGFGFGNDGSVNSTFGAPTTVDFFTLALGGNRDAGAGVPGVTYNFTFQLVGTFFTPSASPIITGSFTTDASGRYGGTFASGVFSPAITDPFGSYQARFTLLNNTSSIDGFYEVTMGNSLAVTATPEPASLALLGTGLVGMVGVVRRRRAASRLG